MPKRWLFLSIMLLLLFSLFNVESTTAVANPNQASTVGTSTEMSWQMFWQLFNGYSDWALEWNDGSSWADRKSCLQIIRDYPTPNKCKITLNFTSQEAGDYRLSFGIYKQVKKYVSKVSVWQYELSYEEFTVVFDWSDIKDIAGLAVTHGILDNLFWFRIRRDNVPANYNVELDPSIVGTSTTPSGFATNYSFQRKTFYANGRFWVFYSDGSNMVYSSSVDGGTWATKTTVRTASQGSTFSVWFNGSYGSYAYASGLSGGDMYYRMGIPQSNGVISWVASEQTISSPSGYLQKLYISVDSSGYPFISYSNDSASTTGTPRVLKSSTNDGTWTTDTGFPYTANSTVTFWATSIVPMNDNRTYLLYASNSLAYGRLWDGSSWGSEETATSSNLHGCVDFSIVAEGDTIHLAFLNDSYSILYRERTYGVGWGTEATVHASASQDVTLSIYNSTGTLYLFWRETDDIYLKQQQSGVWDTDPTELISESNLVGYTLTSWYDTYQELTGVAYTQGSASPYNVKFTSYPDYYYEFRGVYDEETGLLKDVGERAVNVTVYFTGGVSSQSFELNGTYYLALTTQPLYFSYNLTNNRQYWLGSEEYSGIIYVFDDSTTVYTITFLDLAGALDDYPFVEAQRYVNGSLYTVEKRKVDEEKKIAMSLVNGEKYTITIQDGSSYTYGDLLMTSTTTVQLTLKGIEFPKETLLTYKYVRIYATRAFGDPNGNITITYEDTLEMTISVAIYINYKNGTNVYTTTKTSDSFVVTWTSALNNTDYALVCNINHERYGVFPWRQYFPRAFSESPWSLSFLGTLSFDTSIILPALLILFVAACFSVINAEVGAFMAVLVAAVLTYLGWIPIAPGYLITAFCLAILMGIIYAKRRIVT